jgi:hypothetical protein
MKDPLFVMVKTVTFYDMVSSVTVNFHEREGHEWYVKLSYKTIDIAGERVTVIGKQPTAVDARQMFLKHQAELDKVLPLEQTEA